MKNYDKIANNILTVVGGNENISNATHCMTRLRLNLVDEQVDLSQIKSITGVIGAVFSNGQLQIIIGQEVDRVYQAFADLLGTSNSQSAAESTRSDTQKKKITISMVLDTLSGCLTPLIPIIIAASMFKMFIALLGTGMLGWIEKNSDTYQALNVIADAGFYFLPVFVAYSAAKKLGASPMLSMLFGAILIHPSITAIAGKSGSLDILGLHTPIHNYASSIIPTILTVLVFKYVERFLKDVVPESIRSVGVPTLSVAVMFPIMMCIIAPAGAFIGSYICNGLLGFYNVAGALGVAVVGALFMLLVLSGMHLVLISQLILVFQSTGQETLVCPAATAASFAVAGVALGSVLCLQNKAQRNLSVGYLIAVAVGGVTEPTLYGVCIRYKKPIVALMAGGFFGALYMGVMHVTCYQLLPTSSFVAALSFAGESQTNLINGFIGCGIAFIISTFVTYMLGCKEESAQ